MKIIKMLYELSMFTTVILIARIGTQGMLPALTTTVIERVLRPRRR
ncbi:MAG TPA: hypothetical protein VGH16_07665 [Candidatus Binatia bacterium]